MKIACGEVVPATFYRNEILKTRIFSGRLRISSHTLFKESNASQPLNRVMPYFIYRFSDGQVMLREAVRS